MKPTVVVACTLLVLACGGDVIVEGGDGGPRSVVPWEDTFQEETAVQPDLAYADAPGPGSHDVHVPPGVEQCNGADDDGDGEIDETGAVGCHDFYMDKDDDGWGAGDAVCLCHPEGMFQASKGGDCMDDSPYVHPEAQENCYNLIDDDCDGESLFPDCVGKECGPDGCGEMCGTCPANFDCVDFKCISTCTPQCAGKQCGPDACNGVCGICQGASDCVNGKCVCNPKCSGKQCGPDGCGGFCGTCLGATICEDGKCLCAPLCDGKNCGPDGCGGQCGDCQSYQACSNNQCLGWKYEAESPGMGHEQGKKEGDGWACNTGEHSKNMMLFGPYEKNIPSGKYIARFRMQVDNNTADNSTVVKLDVHDSTTMKVLTSKGITRKMFNQANSYQDLDLTFTAPGANHSMEFRVEWFDTSYVRIDRVTVTPDF